MRQDLQGARHKPALDILGPAWRNRSEAVRYRKFSAGHGSACPVVCLLTTSFLKFYYFSRHSQNVSDGNNGMRNKSGCGPSLLNGKRIEWNFHFSPNNCRLFGALCSRKAKRNPDGSVLCLSPNQKHLKKKKKTNVIANILQVNCFKHFMSVSCS